MERESGWRKKGGRFFKNPRNSEISVYNTSFKQVFRKIVILAKSGIL
jgi:hypothetical protein